MILYHGSDCIVEKPDNSHSLRRLDFGCGFYLTAIREQAERWAHRKALLAKKVNGYVSIYEMAEESHFHIIDFKSALLRMSASNLRRMPSRKRRL